MPTPIEQITALEDKIVIATARKSDIDSGMIAIQNSISGPDTGCMDGDGVAPMSKPWEPNTPTPNYIGPNYKLCTSYWKTMDLWSAELKQINSDLITWQSQIDTLKQDPTVISYYSNQKLKRALIVVAVIVVIAAGVYWFLHKKGLIKF